MEDAKEVLRLIHDKHAHKGQASIKNGKISRSRRANHGGGNQDSHNGETPMPNLRTKKRTISLVPIVKLGMRASKSTPSMWKGRSTALQIFTTT